MRTNIVPQEEETRAGKERNGTISLVSGCDLNAQNFLLKKGTFRFFLEP
jgi:hypothetical protein